MRQISIFRLVMAMLLLVLGPGLMSAQSNDVDHKKNKRVEKQSGVVYELVDENPEYPGGLPALQAFLMENLKYPAKAQKKGIEGRVLVTFVVAKDGSIVEIKPINKVHSLLKKEAVRVVKLMPNWVPGKKDGKVVRVRFTLPITFKLPKDELKY